MRRILNLVPWAAMLIMGAVLIPPRATTQERHPHIRAAMNELREAREELRTAAHDFCGHRRQAVHQCDEAIRQLQLAIDCDRR